MMDNSCVHAADQADNVDSSFPAAQAYNIDALYRLLKENPYHLENIDKIPFVDTPLHAAAAAGSTHFAIEILRLKPSFGRKLNPDGFSPLDLALRVGRTETVERLVDYDPELIRVQGKEGFTPLHYVAAQVNVNDGNLLAKFLLRSPKSIEDLTIRGETAVHVAVKHNNVITLRVLLEWLQRTHNEQILNWKDEMGNTVLHIAASTNNYEFADQAVNMLMNTKIEFHIKNLEGSKALDISTDERISNILRDKELSGIRLELIKSLVTRLFRFLFGAPLENPSMEQINAILVIAALIATATYQALLSPPDGFSSGDDNSKSPITGAMPLQLFLSANTTAFFCSTIMIELLLTKIHNSRLLRVSLFFLNLSFGFTWGLGRKPGADSHASRVIYWITVGISTIMWFSSYFQMVVPWSRQM